MCHGVVARTRQDVDVGLGEAEGGKDGAAWGSRGGFDFELDLAAAAGHFDRGAVGDVPVAEVVGVDFEGFLGEEVVDATGASGLGARVVGLQTTTGGEPDGVVVVDDFGGIAVADDLEEARLAVLEFILVKNRGAGVAFFGDGPLVVAVADVVPVEALVNRAEGAEFVEDVFGRFKFEAGDAEFFGDA